MTLAIESLPLIDDELDFLADLVPLAGREIIELGCGAAGLARSLLSRYPDSRVTGLEVDARQHAKNIAAPHPAITFIAAGAEAIPFPAASFDLAMMLKSLHHVPLPLMVRALGEVARVLRQGGHLYVSEPVYAGLFNDVVRLFNDEGVVRVAAQAALDRALLCGQMLIVLMPSKVSVQAGMISTVPPCVPPPTACTWRGGTVAPVVKAARSAATSSPISRGLRVAVASKICMRADGRGSLYGVSRSLSARSLRRRAIAPCEAPHCLSCRLQQGPQDTRVTARRQAQRNDVRQPRVNSRRA